MATDTKIEELKKKYGIQSTPVTPTINPQIESIKAKYGLSSQGNEKKSVGSHIKDFFFAATKQQFGSAKASANLRGSSDPIIKAQNDYITTENDLRKRIQASNDKKQRDKLIQLYRSTREQRNALQEELGETVRTSQRTVGQQIGDIGLSALETSIVGELPVLATKLVTKTVGKRLFPEAGKATEQFLGRKLGTESTKDLGVLGKTPTELLPQRVRDFSKPLPSAEYQALNPILKLGQIAKETLPLGVQSTGIGYGFDVASGLQQGESVGEALKPGAGTALGAALPVGIGTLRSSVIPIKTGSTFVRSFGKPTEEMIAVEQIKLKNAFDDFFKQRESIESKNAFLKSQGKDPSGTLSKFGLLPDTEYTNGKTVVRTEQSIEKTNDLIGSRGEAIQKQLDTVEKLNPSSNVGVKQLAEQAKSKARKEIDGIELDAVLNKIDRMANSLETKYGEIIGVGNINRERIATNKQTKAFLKPQSDIDAEVLLGDVFRKHIDNVVKNKNIINVNKEIGELMSARKLLYAIDGKNIGGGRFTNIIASSAGAMIASLSAKESGAIVQIVNAVLASIGVKAFLRAVASGKFGGNTSKRIFATLLEDTTLLNKLKSEEPKLFREAFAKEISKYNTDKLLLKAGDLGTTRGTIELKFPTRESSVKSVPAERNLVTVNPKTGKFQRSYNSNPQSDNKVNIPSATKNDNSKTISSNNTPKKGIVNQVINTIKNTPNKQFVVPRSPAFKSSKKNKQ